MVAVQLFYPDRVICKNTSTISIYVQGARQCNEIVKLNHGTTRTRAHMCSPVYRKNGRVTQAVTYIACYGVLPTGKPKYLITDQLHLFYNSSHSFRSLETLGVSIPCSSPNGSSSSSCTACFPLTISYIPEEN